jgi:tetratricopeptide (TPR) repeat protein
VLQCSQDALDEAERWAGARKLEPERENLRAAMTWTLDAGRVEASLVLATAYSILCVYRGPFSEGRSWLAAALQADVEHASAERAPALLAAASLAERQRDLEPAREFAQAGLSLARKIDDPTSVLRALMILGVVGGVEGDYGKAESTLREALTFASRAGDDRMVREALAMLGWVALARRDYTQARAVIGEGLELSRGAGDARGIFYGTGNLGHVAAREGRYDEALQLFRESLLIGRQQDLQSEADVLQEVAAVAAAQGRYEEAAVSLGAAEGLREGIQAEQEEVARGLRDETLSILRRNLEEDHFEAAGERGRQMTLEQAVEYAVQLIDSTST